MNEARIMYELRDLHKRCDNQSAAINSLTSALSYQILLIRAYENTINQSWWLTRWLSQKKILREMKRVDDLEGKLRDQQVRLKERAIRRHQQIVEKKDEEAARNKATGDRRRELKKIKRRQKKEEAAK